MFSFLNKNKDDYSQSGPRINLPTIFQEEKGIYLEIGAHHPVINSNTYRLEVECGWKGLSVEFDQSFKKFWDDSKILFDFTLHYNFKEYSFPDRYCVVI